MPMQLTFPEGAALVSGGTGRVGEGVTRTLAAADVPVVFTYRGSEDRAAALEEELTASGAVVRRCRMDLTDIGSIDAAIDAAKALGNGRIHAVVSAGGPMISFGKLASLPPELVREFMHQDTLGIFQLFARGVAALRENGGGSLTACTTIANRRVVDFDGLSPFSKGSIEALVRQIAAEEADGGIRCNAVPVSWVNDYDKAQQLAELNGLPEPQYGMVVALMDQLDRHTRLKRPGTTLEVGNLFAFLASDQAKYITGQSIAFDGGFSL